MPKAKKPSKALYLSQLMNSVVFNIPMLLAKNVKRLGRIAVERFLLRTAKIRLETMISPHLQTIGHLHNMMAVAGLGRRIISSIFFNMRIRRKA